uniref:Cytochrome b561-like n=1 Tax=Hirondellea gigas TaxID=1518452 RepID=A0A2P2HZH0_9CRUS
MPESAAADRRLLPNDSDADGNLALRRDWETGDEGGSLVGRVSRMEVEAQNLRTFTKVYTFTQILGVLMLVLMTVWLVVYRGGFAWRSNPGLEFNWHPIFMLSGMVFLTANGLLIYRGFRTERKPKLKVLHALLQVAALVFAIIALVAVLDSHNLHTDAEGNPAPIPNFYSIHSWLGLTVIILFCCQWLFGLISFLYPGLRQSLKDWYLPLHQFFGMAVFLGAVVTSLLGISEKAFFAMPLISTLPSEGALVNCLCMVVVLFAGLVLHLVSHSSYKRRTTEEDVLLAAGAYME